MANLLNFKSIYGLVGDLYGIDVPVDEFESLAFVGWNRINNKHTRLYRYVADTDEKGVLELPCNVDMIEAVRIPLLDTQATTTMGSFANYDSIYTENYIEAWHTENSPFYQSGKLLNYKEGDGVLYFDRPYHHVMVIYHGVLVDDEGYPLITEKEQYALATFIAYSYLYRDGIRKKDQVALSFAKDVYGNWLRACNAARIPEHLSQNEMNEILDVKTRWDRKFFGKSMNPLI